MYKNELRVGSRVKLAKDFSFIHQDIDNRSSGQPGWNTIMKDFSEMEVTIITIYSIHFAFECIGSTWHTYFECLDTNFKPK